MKGYVLAFDLSVTAPGAVALPLLWRLGQWSSVKAWLGKFKSPPNDDQAAQLQRYAAIGDWACAIVASLGAVPIHAYVEGYSFGHSTNQQARIIESRGVIRHELFKRTGTLLTPVAPASARKLFLGFNPTKKEGYDAKLVVQDNLFNVAKAPVQWDENQADAFVVANYGLSEQGGVPLMFNEKQTRKSKFRQRVNAQKKPSVRRV